MEERSEPPDACLNCGEPGPGRYCSACGQSSSVERLRLREVLATAIEQVFDLDLPIIRTVIGMTIRPGRMCREYIDGKRKRYTNPLKYCFIMAALLVLAFTVLGVSPSAAFQGDEAATTNVHTADEIVRIVRESDERMSGEEIGALFESYFKYESPRIIEQNLNFVAFFAMPFLALVVKLLFIRKKLTYAEHLVFVLFIYGHLMLVNSVLSIAGVYGSVAGIVAVNVLELGYSTWAASVFYRAGVLTSLLRMLVMTIAYSLISVVLSGIVLSVQAVILFARVLAAAKGAA